MVHRGVVGDELHEAIVPQFIIVLLIVGRHLPCFGSNRIHRVITLFRLTDLLFRTDNGILQERHPLVDVPLLGLAHLTITTRNDFSLVQGTLGSHWHVVLIVLKRCAPIEFAVSIVSDTVD